jgi:hypothetical protein
MADQETQNRVPPQPDAKTTPSKKMIGGGAFAVMIILGGILGDVVIYTLLFAFLHWIAFVIGIALLVISLLMIRRTSEVSGATYVYVLLGCIGLPLLGGIGVYLIAKSLGLTK